VFKDSPVSITKNTIVIFERVSGSFLFFSHDGAPKSKFNHKGNGPGEYTHVNHAVYDEEKDELFSVFRNKIEVYSSAGKHKRTLTLPDGTQISDIVSFDDNSLFIYDFREIFLANMKKMSELYGVPEYKEQQTDGEKYQQPFVRISKIDGSIIAYATLPKDNQVELIATTTLPDGKTIGLMPGRSNRIVNYRDGFLLSNPETDTVFFCDKDLSLTPAITQTPSVKTLKPAIYVNNFVDAGQYRFIEIFTLKTPDRGQFPTTFLALDKESGEIYKQKIVFTDFSGKEISISPSITTLLYDSQTGFLQFDLSELKKAYDENKLSGKLKELVASSNDEDNNIYALLHFK
jgi:hypothetical protein